MHIHAMISTRSLPDLENILSFGVQYPSLQVQCPRLVGDSNLGFLAEHRLEATELPVEFVVICFQLGKLIFRERDGLRLSWPPRAPTLVFMRSISSGISVIE
jgi:hypothetical protein